MASIDLNIINRGTQGTEWTAQNTGIQASQLDKVKEQKTDNSNALNSLPTPFARFFVAKEAFRRVAEEKRNSRNTAGMAYTRLVSDILDVYELLFNLKYHTNAWGDSTKLVIKEWEKTKYMEELRNKVPILYNALNAYYKIDIKEDVLYFVVLEKNGKDFLLATSSPMTGFVTPPDLDKTEIISNNTPNIKMFGEQYQNLKIRRKNGKGYYFRDIVLFDKRDSDFKNYMHELFCNANNLDSRYTVVRDYLRLFDNDPEIVNDYKFKLDNIFTEYNTPLVINGLNLRQNDEVDINSFFEPSIIKLPYRINRDNFKAIKYERDIKERDYDYLIPLKGEALSYLEDGAEYECQIKKHSVLIKFTYNGHTYEKEYREEENILDLGRNKQNLELGLFPNILSDTDEENNYFKFALTVADNNEEWTNLNITDVNIACYKKDDKGIYALIEEAPRISAAKSGLREPIVRSNSDMLQSGTKYFELFNSYCDAIQISIKGISGFVLPEWRKAKRTNDSFTYAIDLGTSNTFVSRTKNGSDEAPEMIKMSEPMVSYLHEYENKSQYSEVHNIEESLFEQARTLMKTEFVPPFIDEDEYKFPIRTALCKAKAKVEAPELFNNHNIAFFYEKMMETDFQECITDIKWNEDEELIKIFIREMLLIIKCDILYHNGMLNQTNIIWFRPLSFTGKAKRCYEKNWKQLANEILFTDNVSCYTESEAPYYFFKKMDIIKNTDSVAIIDIGGGSTDMVYFNENKPISASSVHFGCDVLWGNAHNGFSNVKSNGIYKAFIDNLNWKQNEEFRKLEIEMKQNSKSSTTDIINFWLSNQDKNNIIERLQDSYLPLFVYHLTALIFYMAKMYKFKGYEIPRTIIFSGNGSKYIDNFITEDSKYIEEAIKYIFEQVYGDTQNIHVVLPSKRKESTCYGGLYRPKNAESVPETIYQGVDREYANVGEMNADNSLQSDLIKEYKQLSNIYSKILDLFKKEDLVDNSIDLLRFKDIASSDYTEDLSTHYRSEVTEKFNTEDVYNDSVFFIPIIDKVFALTQLD